MEEKFSKFTETLEKKSTALESQSKRIAAAKRFDWSLGRGRCGDRAGAEKKVKILAVNMDNMENRSRQYNIHVLNLEEGTGGNTLCCHTTVVPSG